MKTIKYNKTKINISAIMVDEGVSFPNSSKKAPKTLHNQFEITIEIDGNEATFDFYDSQSNHEKGITKLDDLINPFYCILSDAMCGDSEFDDFCAEFGYDDDSIKAYNACVESKDKLTDIMPDNWDLYELTNFIQEKYDV